MERAAPINMVSRDLEAAGVEVLIQRIVLNRSDPDRIRQDIRKRSIVLLTHLLRRDHGDGLRYFVQRRLSACRDQPFDRIPYDHLG